MSRTRAVISLDINIVSLGDTMRSDLSRFGYSWKQSRRQELIDKSNRERKMRESL